MPAVVAAVEEMAAEVAVEVTLESLNVLVGSVMVGQEIAVEMVAMVVMAEMVDEVDGAEDMPGMDHHGLTLPCGKAVRAAMAAVEATLDQEEMAAVEVAAAVAAVGVPLVPAAMAAVVVTMAEAINTVADIMETAVVEEETVAEAVEITVPSSLLPTMVIDIPNVS